MLDRVKREAALRRAAIDDAQRLFPTFLDDVVAPVCRQVVQALKAEGHAFSIFTPAGALRLVSDKSADDFIAFELDTASPAPGVLGRVSVTRGRRVLSHERLVGDGKPVAALAADDVLDFLMDELSPFVSR
ncbi:MAG: hypothetical protein U0Q12_20220 [Vicinamibacterales bacterium]